jgi:hypothetical protein
LDLIRSSGKERHLNKATSRVRCSFLGGDGCGVLRTKGFKPQFESPYGATPRVRAGLASSDARVRTAAVARLVSELLTFAGSSATKAVLSLKWWFCQREALPG